MRTMEVRLHKMWCMAQGPISRTIFPIRWFHSALTQCCAKVIAMKLCTWHDRYVVACAKFCSDMTPCDGVILKQIFHRNWISSKIFRDMLNRSQRNFSHITTVTLSWRVQNFVVIGRLNFKPVHGKCWPNFDRNIVSGTGTRSVWIQTTK